MYNRLIHKELDADGDGSGTPTDTFWIHDGNQPVLEFDGDTAADLSHRYLWGPAVDQLLADETVDDGGPEDILWPLTDWQGSVRHLATYDAATDTTTVANEKFYDAYGNVTSESNSAVDTIFGYTGQMFDDDTGLQNNLNRWYDPVVGRWISEDPIGFAAGDANLYRYVGNHPTLLVDPSGLADESPDRTWLGFGYDVLFKELVDGAYAFGAGVGETTRRVGRGELGDAAKGHVVFVTQIGLNSEFTKVGLAMQGGFVGGWLSQDSTLQPARDYVSSFDTEQGRRGATAAPFVDAAGESAAGWITWWKRPAKKAAERCGRSVLAEAVDDCTALARYDPRSAARRMGLNPEHFASLPALRQQYVTSVFSLRGKADALRRAGKSSEEIARVLYAKRRAIGVRFKNLTPADELERIYARNLRKYGDRLGPTLEYLRNIKGKSWEDIIESASRVGGKDLGY